MWADVEKLFSEVFCLVAEGLNKNREMMRFLSLGFFYIVGFWFCLLSYLLYEAGFFYSGFFITVVAVCVVVYVSDKNNLFHMLWLSSFFLFSLLPFAIVFYQHDVVAVSLLPILLAFTFIVFWLTRRCVYVKSNSLHSISAWVYCLAQIVTIFIAAIGYSEVYAYAVPLLLVFYYFALKRLSAIQGFFLCVFFCASIFLYFVFWWSGFGRLVLAGWSIVPVLVFILQYDIKYNKIIFCLGICVIGVVMSSLRFDVQSFEDLIYAISQDSVVGPYMLAAKLHNAAASNPLVFFDFSGWLEQFGMLVYGAFPRFLWETKPLGFGYQYTVDNLDSYLVDAGHSVAGLFVAEHLYYLGVLGFVSCLLTLYIMTIFYRFLFRLDYGSGAYALVFLIWLQTFFWGGIASFAQRFQLGAFVVLIFWLGYTTLRKSLTSRP